MLALRGAQEARPPHAPERPSREGPRARPQRRRSSEEEQEVCVRRDRARRGRPVRGGVRDRNAAFQRARERLYCCSQLEDERAVDAVVVEDSDLDVVEGEAVVEDATEHGTDLVLLAQGGREPGRAPASAGGLGSVLGERDRCRSVHPRGDVFLLERRKLEALEAGKSGPPRWPQVAPPAGAGGIARRETSAGSTAPRESSATSRTRGRAQRAPAPLRGSSNAAAASSAGVTRARRSSSSVRWRARWRPTRCAGERRSTTRVRGPRRRRTRRRRGAARGKEGGGLRPRGRHRRRRGRARKRSRAGGSGVSSRSGRARRGSAGPRGKDGTRRIFSSTSGCAAQKSASSERSLLRSTAGATPGV